MSDFFAELKRRNVFRVGVAYAVMGWVLVEVSSTMLGTFEAPLWVAKAFTTLIIIGFPVALLFAWAFELTPDGLMKTADVDASSSVTHSTGRKLDFTIIGMLALAVLFLVWDNYLSPGATPQPGDSGDKSIAVLPFVNMSSDAEQEYFSDGITGEILNALVAVDGLSVVGRTSSFAFKGKNEDLRQIGVALGVDHLVEGSVRKAGLTVRITAQLIRADTGRHLWSETYDRDITDIFKVQDEISAAIAGALKVALLGAEAPPTTVTVDPEAFDLYLQARRDLDLQSVTSFAAAVEKLIQVKRMAPEFLKARLALSQAYWSEANYGSRSERQALALAEAEARAVLAIDPDFAEAYVALARVSGGSLTGAPGDPAAALTLVETALEMGANTGDAWGAAARWRAAARDHTGARAAIERAIALDPMNGELHNDVGAIYSIMGDHQAADRSHARSIALQPTTANWWNLATLRQFELGDIRGAIEAYQAAVALDPTEPEALAALAAAWLDIGDLGAADQVIQRSLDRSPDLGFSQLILAGIILQRGQRAQTLALMRASLDDPATVHRYGSFTSLTADLVQIHMEDGNFAAAEARLLTSYPALADRLTVPPPADFRPGRDDLTTMYIQVLRARGEDRKAEALTAYSDLFGEDYIRGRGAPTDGSRNWGLANAALAAGDAVRALDYLEAAYAGGQIATWRSAYGGADFYALWDHPRHKALMARIEADMGAVRIAMMADGEAEGANQ